MESSSSVLVVAADVQERWALADALDVPASRALGLEEGRAVLAHPAAPAPEAVVLVLRGDEDLAWLRWLRDSSTRPWVAVVALVDGDGAAAAADPLVDHLELLEGARDRLVTRLRRAIGACATPQLVLSLLDETGVAERGTS